MGPAHGRRAPVTAGHEHRRVHWPEVIGWIAIVAVLWGVDLLAKMSERDLGGIGKDDFRLVSEQVTSGLAVLVMIPFVLRWLRMFPLRRDAWAPAVIGHTVGSVFFAFGHHSLMVALRVPWYALNGLTYVWREHYVSNLVVEYQKDIKVYAGIVLVATAWGLYRGMRPADAPATGFESGRVRAGPAPPAAPATTSARVAGTGAAADGTPTPPAAASPPGPVPGRLLVQTGRGESILRYEDIECLEAARNYVAVHAAGREYVVRETMARLEERLADGPFVRTHRSFIVNLDRIVEIRTAGSRARVRLASGREVPLSRGYRDALATLLSP